MRELAEWIEFVDCDDNQLILVRREDILEVWELPWGRAKVSVKGDHGHVYMAGSYEAVRQQLSPHRA